LLIQVWSQVHSENKDREVNGWLKAMEFFEMKAGSIITQKQTDVLNVGSKTINLVTAHAFLMENGKGFLTKAI
jgi:hypothetical protein